MEQESLNKIEAVTRKVIEALGITSPTISVEWQEDQERIYARVEASADNGFLIGKEGRILEALKEIIEAASSRALDARVDIYLDIGQYWSKIENQALESAKRAAEEAARTGRGIRLEPMHPMLRRFLHKALQNDPEVETVSEGEGTWKRIIVQRKSSQPI